LLLRNRECGYCGCCKKFTEEEEEEEEEELVVITLWGSLAG
jgi:dissimilatory sulfite reductase (desulfoviridin) alpha/beta subunit